MSHPLGFSSSRDGHHTGSSPVQTGQAVVKRTDLRHLLRQHHEYTTTATDWDDGLGQGLISANLEPAAQG